MDIIIYVLIGLVVGMLVGWHGRVWFIRRKIRRSFQGVVEYRQYFTQTTGATKTPNSGLN